LGRANKKAEVKLKKFTFLEGLYRQFLTESQVLSTIYKFIGSKPNDWGDAFKSKLISLINNFTNC